MWSLTTIRSNDDRKFTVETAAAGTGRAHLTGDTGMAKRLNRDLWG